MSFVDNSYTLTSLVTTIEVNSFSWFKWDKACVRPYSKYLTLESIFRLFNRSILCLKYLVASGYSFSKSSSVYLINLSFIYWYGKIINSLRFEFRPRGLQASRIKSFSILYPSTKI